MKLMLAGTTTRAARRVASLKQYLILALAGTLMGFMLVALGTSNTHAAAFAVNTQTDAVDAYPGDGLCATAALPGEGVRCSLRAAIMEANTLAGPDQVTLPPGTYKTTIPGTGEDAAVDIAGQVGRTGRFSVPLPTQPQGVLFLLRRLAPGAAMVQLIVTDSCGPWRTFVGLGAGAP